MQGLVQYIMDTYTIYCASAIASTVILRCIQRREQLLKGRAPHLQHPQVVQLPEEVPRRNPCAAIVEVRPRRADPVRGGRVRR